MKLKKKGSLQREKEKYGKNERESFVMRDWRPTELKLWEKQAGPPSWRR